ncbi:MAG: phage Gp37/Gp68 family protein [Clostridiales bacterium]|nr:phage Gp37/Gp68 family protein [Clostridiales bacterium]
MNRSAIEWCDHTWNPITGCRHGCEYCYARRMVARFSGDVRLNKMAKDDYKAVPARDGSGNLYVLEKAMLNETGKPLVYPFGFEPTFHQYRLDTMKKLKMGNNIFVGAMSDVWGDWVPDEWIEQILIACENLPIHNYLFLTKNPKRYVQADVPAAENFWYGTTITDESNADRFNRLPAGCYTFVSIEPLLSDIAPEHNIMFRQVDWVIIGAETGFRKGKVTPKREWVENIVYECDRWGTPVFMKESMLPIMGEEGMRREYPEQLQIKKSSEKMIRKLFDKCCMCTLHYKKSDMVALLARSARGRTAKQYAYMCKACFEKFSIDNGIEIPEGLFGDSEEDDG